MNVIVVGRGLPAGQAEQLAALHSWQAGEGPAEGQLALSFRRHFGADTLAACLTAPYVAGVQWDDQPIRRLGAHFLAHLTAGGLGLCLRTDTAYHSDADALFAEALRRRMGAAARVEGLDLVVHELMVNALVHGNLGVASCSADHRDFLDYCRRLDERLADPVLVARRIEISALATQQGLELAVRDEGAGYDLEARQRSGDDHVRFHGLTLASARARLRVEDGGRCAVLQFNRPEGGDK